MSDVAAADAAPALKVRAPPLRATRLRGRAVKGLVGVAALVGASAFIYAFVVAPKLKARAASHTPPAAAKPSGEVRPNEKITGQPAGYDQIATASGTPILTTRAEVAAGASGTGADRGSGSSSDPGGAPQTSAGGAAAQAGDLAQDGYTLARTSELFFAHAEATAGSGRPTPASASEEPMASRPPPATQAQADYEASYGRHVLIAPRSPFELKAGTLVGAALLTAVDTERPGPVVALTTAPLFDTVSGRFLLVPQGSRLIGQEGGDNSYGEARAFVVWKRLILPNGKSLLLEDQAATDAAGAVGVPGQVDHRFLQLGAAILASGAITTLGELAQGDGSRGNTSLVGTVGDATAVEAASVGGRLIDRELRVQPKVRVSAGAPVQVLLTKDLVLEPYAP